MFFACAFLTPPPPIACLHARHRAQTLSRCTAPCRFAPLRSDDGGVCKERAPLWQQSASTVAWENRDGRVQRNALRRGVMCCAAWVGVLVLPPTVPGEPQERAQRHLELVRVPPCRAAAARVLAARSRPRLRRRQSDGSIRYTTTCCLDPLVAQRRLCEPSAYPWGADRSAPSSTRVPAAPWNRSPSRSFSSPFCFTRA